MTNVTTNIVWFRNDLRTIDNLALTAALAAGNVRAVFCITLKQWQEHHNWGDNKVAFVLKSAISLQQQLHKLNIILDFIDCDDFKTLPDILTKYLKQHNAAGLFYESEYELNELQRDIAVAKAVKHNIPIHELHNQTLIQPGIILNKQNKPYTVFTPFKRASYFYLHAKPLHLAAKPQPQKQKIAPINNEILEKKFAKFFNNQITKQWDVGEIAAAKILDDFCEHKIAHYKQQRDFPDLSGTSTLSPYLAIGSISVKQCFLTAIAANDQEMTSGNANIICWLDELLWRDFYKQITYHFPEVCKEKNFNHKYDKLNWQPPGENLQRWQQGQTGIPIIDAAMRQLIATGWMHNRLRMIVAMFLTKNLLIDWRHGEHFFSQHLVDLDFASNNGGWQWSASTGTDAVPYFRIFNPISQSAKFDPNGKFIKQFCPELLNLNSKQIHDPSSYLNEAELAKLSYPKVMVDIAKSRLRALDYFKKL